MNKTALSPHYLRKRKMLMALPLLVLPFITMGFWALGGGKATGVPVQEADIENGLNLQLPDAKLKTDKGLDKMSYYEMAAADSDKLKARMRNDPYFKLSNSVAADTEQTINGTHDDSMSGENDNGLNASGYLKSQNGSASETKVYQKLKQINAALESATTSQKLTAAPAVNNKDADRLESMMQQLRQDNGGSDTEMNQINSMLEKVMDIQHPERLSEKYKQYNEGFKKPAFSVTGKDETNTGFYGASNEDSNSHMSNSFPAVVSDKQTVVNGAIIKFRLMADVYINGTMIPKDNFIFGKVSLNGERLSVSIGSIRYRNDVLPVAMSVFDMDGMEGIYVPGAITRDVAKQSADNAFQSVALNSLDPSIGAQAAGAGIETAKTLISKKVKLVRVTVKAGYQVLLKNNDNK